MRNYLFFLWLFFLILQSCTLSKKTSSAISTVPCNCLATINTNYNNIYKISNTKSVVLCANKSQENNQEVYNSIYIKNCTSDDTLGFSSQNYISNNIKDTLELIPYYYLPQGLEYTYKQTTVFIEKIYFTTDNKLQKTKVLNPYFPKYTQSQILDVFEEYQLTTATTDEKVILLMDKLLMASLSGNQLAMKTFRNFEAKYKAMNSVQKAKYEQNKQILIEYLAF
jgi:hypothetical protein